MSKIKEPYQVFDDLWAEETLFGTLSQLKINSELEVFSNLLYIIRKKFGNIEGLKIIELGAGVGKVSILLSMVGAEITLLDRSEEAKKQCKELFSSLGLKSPNYLIADIFDLDNSLMNKYDVSLSFGLVEHFKDKQRLDSIKAHHSVLKEGGLSYFSVPNKNFPSYKIYKFISELTGDWPVGVEYPFTERELYSLTERASFNKIQTIISDYDYVFNSNINESFRLLQKRIPKLYVLVSSFFKAINVTRNPVIKKGNTSSKKINNSLKSQIFSTSKFINRKYGGILAVQCTK